MTGSLHHRQVLQREAQVALTFLYQMFDQIQEAQSHLFLDLGYDEMERRACSLVLAQNIARQGVPGLTPEQMEQTFSEDLLQMIFYELLMQTPRSSISAQMIPRIVSQPEFRHGDRTTARATEVSPEDTLPQVPRGERDRVWRAHPRTAGRTRTRRAVSGEPGAVSE